MSAFAPLLAWLALGAPTGLAFWIRGRRALALAVMPTAGALALLLPAALSPWWGGSLAGWPWLAGLAALALAAVSHGLLRRAPPPPPAPAPPSPAAMAVAVALTGAACTLPLAVGLELWRGWPGYEWDGLVIWLVRTRVLVESGGLPLALFREPALAQGHWDYPLLFPALLAWFGRLGGLEIRQLALALGLFATLFPLATALGLLRPLRLPLAAAVALVPFCVPELARYHFHAYADPLLVMLGIAGLAWTTLGALDADRALLLGGGLALAAAVSVKDEGILWWAAGASAAALCWRGPVAGRVVGWLCAGVPGLLLFGVWQLSCRLLETPGGLASQLRWDLLAARLAPLGRAFAAHVLIPANLPLLLGSLLALAVLLPGGPAARLRSAARLLAAPAVLTAGLFGIYLATPHDLRWHVLTSLHRTVYGLVPAVFVAAVAATVLARRGSQPPDAR